MSALPPKADITERDRDVRFVPQADIGLAPVDVRFTPKSGHSVAHYARPPIGSVTVAAIQRN